MRWMRKISVLLAVSLLLISLSSCIRRADGGNPTDPVETTPVSSPPSTTGEPDGETPAYTLTQEALDRFYGMLADCETLFTGEAKDEETLQALLDALEDAYYHIATQAQIAYLLYCVKQSDEIASQNYLFSSSASSDAYAAYNETCKVIDTCESSNREVFFRDWTDEEMEEMRGFSDEITAYQKANDELLVEYRALTDDTFYQNTHLYYRKLIANNNAIAASQGYGNYWDYANAEIYERDTGSERAVMRAFVKQYLVPLMNEAAISFNEAYSALTESERATMSRFLQLDYGSETARYVEGYLDTFEGDVKTDMGSLFLSGNSIFTDSEDSYKGAFTGFLYEYERPICYFGPGYANALTVVHEMGHYYAALEKGDMKLSIDLAEVHSQGNEWMFLSYVGDLLGARIAKALTLYQLYSALSVIIRATMIDDFEERCYRSADLSWSAERFDSVMETVIRDYGGEEWMDTLYLYWRYVVVESPVYYISYAVSMLAALQLYCKAEESYSVGQEAFLSLIQSAAEEARFDEALAAAGLSGAGEEKTYQLICQLVRKG